jgi:hypothetical protein
MASPKQIVINVSIKKIKKKIENQKNQNFFKKNKKNRKKK